MVERLLPKQKVAGSIPVSCSKELVETFTFEAIFDAQGAKFARRTSRYGERICDAASRKETKCGRFTRHFSSAGRAMLS